MQKQISTLDYDNALDNMKKSENSISGEKDIHYPVHSLSRITSFRLSGFLGSSHGYLIHGKTADELCA